MRHSNLALLALSALASPGLAQTTWHVDAAAVPPGNGTPASPYASLQYAIAQPATIDGDRIEVAPGTYAEAIDFLGKAIHVVGVAGVGLTVIDGGGFAGDRSAVVFQGGEGRDSVLQGLRVTGGAGTYDPTTFESYGGGIRLDGSSPTIVDCLVTLNLGQIGGGIYGAQASPRIVDSYVVSNGYGSSSAQGGGIAFSGGAPALERVVVNSNEALGDGGGLWLEDCRATLRDCEIVFNDTIHGHGGGLYARQALVVFERCLVAANFTFDGNGGGLALGAGGRLTAVECVLTNNFVSNDHDGGGAVVAAGGALTYLGGRIAGNFAADGGGVHNLGQAFIADCLIQDNTAWSLQAGFGSGGGVWGAARLRRCLIAGNQAIAGPAFGSGVGGATYLASLEHCTVVGNGATFESGGAHGGANVSDSIFWGNVPAALGAAGTVTYTDVEGGHPGTGNIDADPLFTDPAAGDYTLTAKSPCIDAGDPSGPLDPDGTRADMGAFPFDQSAAPTAPAAGGIEGNTAAERCAAVSAK